MFARRLVEAKILDILAPAADLLLRLYLAKVFFLSGLTKIADWESTVFLFTEEYHVPLLPPAVAAAAGTAGELLFPLLLALGCFTRLSALGLWMVNLVAAVAYYHVLKDVPGALQDHLEWGLMLLIVIGWQTQSLRLDRFFLHHTQSSN
jgi:putative oxidoreductase